MIQGDGFREDTMPPLSDSEVALASDVCQCDACRGVMGGTHELSVIVRQQACIDELLTKIGWLQEGHAILQKHGLEP